MRASVVALLLSSVMLSGLAQIAFKYGLANLGSSATGARFIFEALMKPAVIAGFVMYGVGALVWLAALSRVPLSQAYPFVGLGFVITALAGWLVFGEVLSIYRLVGIAMIIGGVVLVGAR